MSDTSIPISRETALGTQMRRRARRRFRKIPSTRTLDLPGRREELDEPLPLLDVPALDRRLIAITARPAATAASAVLRFTIYSHAKNEGAKQIGMPSNECLSNEYCRIFLGIVE
jgi:hypothetical protein